MAFEKLEVRATSGRAGLPASISLTNRAGGRPAVIVSLTRELAEGAGLDSAAKCDALIGTGDDAGKIRIVQAEAGLLTPRVLKANSFLLDLGFVEAVGTTAHPKQFTSGRVIEKGVVEVDVPDFGAAVVKALDPTEARGDAPAAPSPRAAAAAPASAAKPKAGAKPDVVNGVAIDLSPRCPSVTFRGKTVEVTERHARLVYLLARPRPAPVASSFLVNALWEGRPASSAASNLQMMCADLKKLLSPIGLDLRLVRGVGYQLKDL